MEIYQELENDHGSILLLLQELVDLNESNQQRRHQLVNKLCEEFVTHARAEEAVLYNSIRMMEAGKEVVMSGYQEHFDAEVILRSLQLREKFNFNWKPSVQKLKKVIDQHVETEQRDIFAAAKIYFTAQEAEVMGETFKNIKTKIRRKGLLGTTRDLLVNLIPPRMMSFSSGMLSPRYHQRQISKAY